MNNPYTSRILFFILLMCLWHKPSQAQVCANNDFVISCSPCYFTGSGYPGYAFFHSNGVKDVNFKTNEDIYYYGPDVTLSCKSSTTTMNLISANLPSGSTLVCQGRIKNYITCTTIGLPASLKVCPLLGSNQYSFMQLQKFRIPTAGNYTITFNNGNGTTVNLTIVDGTYMPPTITITSDVGTTIMAGTSVTFSYLQNFNTNAATNISWKKNGVVTNSSTTYTTNALQNGDVITLSVSYSCDISLANNPLTANNSLTMTVNAVMPVELSSFSGKATKEGNLLTWHTASESNNKQFQIERQDKNGAWYMIGIVGAKNKAANYEYLDDDFTSSLHTYRLKQVDNDGKSAYSKTITVERTADMPRTDLKVYPNPTHDMLNIANDIEGNYQIFNLLGQEVQQGIATSSIAIEQLPQGTYILKVGNQQAKFFKQ